MTQEQDWQEIKGRIQARWPGLPEDELERTRGERESVLSLLRRTAGGDDERLDHDLDLALLDEFAAGSRGVGGMPMNFGQPTDAATAVTGDDYAASEQGAHRIGDVPATAAADASTPQLPSMAERTTDDDASGREQGDGEQPSSRMAS